MKTQIIILFMALFTFTINVNAQLSGYNHYVDITINASQVNGSNSLTNFPVLIDITDYALKTAANGGFILSSNAYDIAFSYLGNTVTLLHEIEDYNGATGSLKAWVKIPTLSSTTNTVIRMHFGKNGISVNPSSENVWSNSYKSVWHLNDDLLDATSNNNNGTNFGTNDIAAKVADGQNFNSSTDKIDVGNCSVSGSAITLSAWFKADNFTTDDGRIISKATSQSENDHYFMLSTVNSNGSKLRFRLKTNGTTKTLIASSGNLIAGTWYYANAVYDGSTMKLYLNNTLVGSTSKTGTMNTNNSVDVFIGNNPGANLKPFDGIIDEVRISNTARSQDWLSTEFNNQNSPSSFYSVGAVDGVTTVVTPNSTTCGQKITFVGIGSQSQSSVTLAIPNINNIDSIRVESVFKGSKPSNVTFSSASQTIVDNTPEYAINGGTDKGSFHAIMNPTSSITITPSNNTSSVHSAVAYIYRSDTNYKSSTQMEIMKVYQYRNNNPAYSKTFSIAPTSGTRNIVATIPVAELNTDSRKIEVTITAGSISKTVVAYKENLGNSLRLFVITLEDVPGNITSVTVDIDSPDSDGDSFVAGNILIDIPCDGVQGPIAIDDYKTTAVNTPVDINILSNDSDPDNDLDYGSVNTVGLIGPSNGSITNVNSANGVVTYTPNPGFIGVDSFEYQVCDQSLLCDVAWVYVTINECGTGYVSSGSAGYADAVSSFYINPSNSHSKTNMNDALGLPDGEGAYVHWGNDFMILDLTDEVPAGEEIIITWRKRPNQSGTSKMILSYSNTNSNFTNHSSIPQTTSETFITSTITVSVATRYLKITKNNSISGTDFEIDAVQYSIGAACSIDSDEDGVSDIDDIDDDNDGILDVVEGKGIDPSADADNDGIPNYMDINFPGFVDVNNDGVNDNYDSDMDGVSNHLDIDSDNDGILDNIEGQSTNAYTSIVYVDSDKDGLMDTYDSNLNGAANSVGISPNDHNNNGTADYLDNDSDNDGVVDWIEAFDSNADNSAYDELTVLGNEFYRRSGLSYYNMNIDNNSNNIADWMEPISSQSTLPAFLDHESSFYYDTDGDGKVDLLDDDNFGDPQTQAELPDGTVDKSWRDIPTDNNPLPVELLSFDAELINNIVKISWITASETNNNFFTIERSSNGIDFEYFTEAIGVGNSNQEVNYMVFDEQPLNGINYYRLKQTDFDGLTKIIGTTFVDNPIKNNPLQISKWNISNSTLNIEYKSGINQSVQFNIYTTAGQLVSSKVTNNTNSTLNTQKFGLNSLDQGIYFLRINNAQEAVTLKFYLSK